MATISETELQRRLRALENSNSQGSGGAGIAVTFNPAGAIERVGDQYEYTSDHIYIAYASTISNDEAGIVPNQSDVTGFQYTPFDSSGTLLSYRGIYKSKSVYASGDPTDYVWEDITTISGFAISERYYTVSSVMLAFLGSPTVLKEGVTWVYLPSGSSVPSTAIYIAERFSIGGVASDWSISPIQNTGAFFIIANGTIVGRNKPVLGSSEWVADAVATVTSFTGRPYSTQRELGYGTVVTIDYDDGKLSGLFKKNGAVDTWVSSGTFIDGDLMVDGTIRAPAIAAGAISASKLVISGSEAITASYIGGTNAEDVSLTRLDIAYFVNDDGSLSGSETNSFPSGTLEGTNYSPATRGIRNYQGLNVVVWTGDVSETAVSTTINDYEITQLKGQDSLTTEINASNGVVFKNGSGNTELRSDVFIGGEKSTDSEHTSYTFDWRYGSSSVCVSSNQELIDDNGNPLVAVNGTCSSGSLATARTILVGAEDVLNTAQFTCIVGNIPN